MPCANPNADHLAGTSKDFTFPRQHSRGGGGGGGNGGGDGGGGDGEGGDGGLADTAGAYICTIGAWRATCTLHAQPIS